MRGNRLQFPVSPQFRRILEDDHEWCVITDTRLNPLVMERGDRKEGLSEAEVKRAYARLKHKIPEGKRIRVYDLHTHPRSGGLVPSSLDIKKFLEEKIINPFNVEIVGQGVITKKGIFIVKLSGTIEELKQLYWNFPDEYRQRSLTRLMNKVDSITPERVAAIKSGELKLRKKTKDISTDAHTRVFDQMQREEPNIKTKVVRRFNRSSLQRRR